MTIRDTKTNEELDDAAIVDACRSFIRVQGRDYERREMNRVLPAVLAYVDKARASGNAPDVKSIIRQAFERKLLS